MPARRSWSFHEGDRYEYFVTFILSAIASVVPVPRQEDYGLDHLCFLTAQRNGLLYAEEAFTIQVKAEGQGAALAYGGNKKGVWREDQVDWLFGQTSPLLVGVVDRKRWALKLFSTAPMWGALPEAGKPFEVILGVESSAGRSGRVPRPTKTRVEGDKPGMRGGSYFVDLGPPIVELTPENLKDDAFRQKIYDVMRAWFRVDFRNLRHRALGIPYAEEVMDWETNEVPALPNHLAGWWFMNATPGFNQIEILKAMSPMVIGLALNMAEQRDEKLSQLSGVLRLLEDKGLLPQQIHLKFSDLLK